MVIENDIKHIRAYDNTDNTERVVVNYTSKSYTDLKSTWSEVQSFFVSCKETFFIVDMRKFKIISNEGTEVDEIDTTDFKINTIGNEGQRELLFETKFPSNSVKILFLFRNKLIRVIENTYNLSRVKGSLFTRINTKIDSLGYIEQI